MKRTHDSRSLDSVDNGSTDCHMYREPDTKHNDNQSDNLLYVAKVEQLASQVRSALSEDSSAELEMYETPVDLPFEGQSFGISLKEALSVKVCDDQIALPECISQKVERPQVTSTVVHKAEEQLEVNDSKSAELSKELGTLDFHHTRDSSVKWLESAFKASTSHDCLPTSMQILDENTLRLNKEGATLPEDRYRLCYTIELSDSSSEEDNNKSSHEYDDHNLVGSTGSNQEANIKDQHYMTLYTMGSDEHKVKQSLTYSTDFEGFSKGSHLIKQYEGVAQAQCNTSQRKQLDHSTSPLFTMSLQQLRQLFLSLEQELNSKIQSVPANAIVNLYLWLHKHAHTHTHTHTGHSSLLIQLLEERDSLSNENKLLKKNIAQLTK